MILKTHVLRSMAINSSERKRALQRKSNCTNEANGSCCASHESCQVVIYFLLPCFLPFLSCLPFCWPFRLPSPA